MRLSSRPRREITATVLALVLASLTTAPAALTADSPELTNGFYVDPDSNSLQWANANPEDGRSNAVHTSIG